MLVTSCDLQVGEKTFYTDRHEYLLCHLICFVYGTLRPSMGETVNDALSSYTLRMSEKVICYGLNVSDPPKFMS